MITGIGIKGRDTTQLEVAARISAPLAAALALIDQPPLGFASKLGIDPASASGSTATRLSIGMPLHRDMDESEVRVAATAELREAGIAGLQDRFDLSDGRFSLTVDSEHAELVGDGAVNQTPLAIQWRESFTDDAPFQRRFQVSGTVDAGAPERFGFALPLPVEGAAGLQATVVEAGGVSKVEVELDLTPLAVAVPQLGWQKAAGAPGRLSAGLSIAPDGPLLVERLELAAAGLEASGSLRLATAPLQLEQLLLTRFRLGRSSGSLDLHRRDAGGYRVSAAGRGARSRPAARGAGGGRRGRGRGRAADAARGDPDRRPASGIAGHALSALDSYAVRDAAGWQSADAARDAAEGRAGRAAARDRGRRRAASAAHQR